MRKLSYKILQATSSKLLLTGECKQLGWLCIPSKEMIAHPCPTYNIDAASAT